MRTFKSEKRVVEGHFQVFSPAIFLDGRNRVAQIGFSFPKTPKDGRRERRESIEKNPLK
jgi:hypothetical protein